MKHYDSPFPLSSVTRRLIRGRRRIAKEGAWIKGQYKLRNTLDDMLWNDEGVQAKYQYCVMGAMDLTDCSSVNSAKEYSVRHFLNKAIIKHFPRRYRRKSWEENAGTSFELSPDAPVAFNDNSATTHKDMMKVLDSAIRMSIRHDCKMSKASAVSQKEKR